MYITKAKPVKSKGKRQIGEDMLLFDEEFMFLKCKQDFAKEREKKINAATESKKKKKKKGTGHGLKKKERFSDLFNRDSCLLHAECCIRQYSKGV